MVETAGQAASSQENRGNSRPRAKYAQNPCGVRLESKPTAACFPTDYN